MERWSDRLFSRPRRVLAVVVATLVLAGLGAWRLRLDTELATLLPADRQPFADYLDFIEGFGGLEQVLVLIDSAEGSVPEEVLLEAAWLLEQELEASDLVLSARSGLEDEDERFLLEQVLPVAPLLLRADQLDSFLSELEESAIDRRAQILRSRLLSPAGVVEAQLLPHDPLGIIERLAVGAVGDGTWPVDPLTGSFLSASGEQSLVIATPSSGEADPAAGRELQAMLDAAFERVIEELSGEHGTAATGLRLRAIGGPLYAASDEALIRGDLATTVTMSALGCVLLLVAAFGEGTLVLAATASVAVALLWTAGVLGILVGDLSAPSLGFGAVLIGLGLDYAIHGGVRFSEERRHGCSATGALGATFRRAGPGIVASALTTAAAFLVLTAADFRPVREAGVFVAVGILALLISTLLVGGSLLAVAKSRHRRPAATRLWRALGWAAHGSVGLARARPAMTLSIAVVALVVALLGLPRLRVEPSLDALRPSDSPLIATERDIGKAVGAGLDTATLIIDAADRDAAIERSRAVTEALRRTEPGLQIASPSDWLVSPAEATERLELFRRDGRLALAVPRLRRSLADHNLSVTAFSPGLEALAQLAEGRLPAPLRHDQLPSWLRELVQPGAAGGPFRVAIRLRLADAEPSRLASIRRTAQGAAPGTVLASAVEVGEALRELGDATARRLALAGLAVVLLVVLVSFGFHVVKTLLALLPVVTGVVVTLGVIAWTGQSLDLLSLAVVPILLGIGIDDGLHAVHGASRLADLAGSIRAAGRAMALTTVTTAVGFGSLLLSGLPGLRTGGLVVAIGVVVCLAATLFVLPALNSLMTSED